MSKFICLCGHRIVDQTDHLPYKAQFFADEDTDASWEQFILFCAELFWASMGGRQKEFLVERFGEEYSQDLTLEDIISDSLGGMRAVFGQVLYECEQCGRLWVEPASLKRKEIYRLVSYFPESEERGVLSSRKEGD